MSILGSNNPFPSILVQQSTTPASPSTGQHRLFVDSTSLHLSRVTSSGAVRDLEDRSLAFGISIASTSGLSTGLKAYVRIPLACTITKGTVLSMDTTATAGSISVDLWKDTYANYPPTSSDSIVASAPLALSSSQSKSEDSTLTGWTKSVSAGDIVGFNVTAVSTALTKVGVTVEASIP